MCADICHLCKTVLNNTITNKVSYGIYRKVITYVPHYNPNLKLQKMFKVYVCDKCQKDLREV